MRRVFVVFLLLAMMYGLETLKTPGASSRDPLTLAAIGFVVLAAFAIAELGKSISLPAVTGYILSGIALGPFGLDVLSHSVVGELRMFSTLTLGLIAMSAGLEIDVRGLVSLARTLSVTILVKVVGGFILVGGTLVLVARATGWLAPYAGNELLALGFVFGALSIGTSPSISLAVTSESRSKGRLTELVLGAAVVKDVVVVVCLSFAYAMAGVALEGADLDVHIVLELGRELGASLVVGMAFGGILIAYLRFVRVEMLLVVTVVVLVANEVCRATHLELLLVLIVAGATVKNLSPYEHALHHPLQTISLPVFVVFFTNAGASVDLQTTRALLPMALVLCGVRAMIYVVASRVGGLVGKEAPPIRRLAWLAYLPQAGVTLGLVGVAAEHVDALARVITDLGMALVAVNLLVGPITLRLALQLAGEIRPESSEPDRELEMVSPDLVVVPRLAPSDLQEVIDGLAQSLAEPWSHWHVRTLAPELRVWRNALRVDPLEPSEAILELGRRLDELPPLVVEARSDPLRDVFAAHRGALNAIPDVIEVPLESHHRRVQPSDRLHARLAKRWSGCVAFLLGRRGRRVRRVRAHRIAHREAANAMTRLAHESLGEWMRFEVLALETMQRAVAGLTTMQRGQSELDLLLESTLPRVLGLQTIAVDRIRAALADTMSWAGAPGKRNIRNGVELDAFDLSIAELERTTRRWIDGRAAAIRTIRFAAEVEHAENTLRSGLRRDVIDPLDESFAGVARILETLKTRVLDLPAADEVADGEPWERLGHEVRTVLSKPLEREFRNRTERIRRATSASAPLTSATSFVSEGEETIRLMTGLDEVAGLADPSEAVPITLNVRELKEVQISRELLPSIQAILDEVAEALSAIHDGASQAASLVEFGWAAAERARADGRRDASARFDESVQRAAAILDEQREGPCRVWPHRRRTMLEHVDRMSVRMFDALALATHHPTRARAERVGEIQARLAAAFSTVRARTDRAIAFVVTSDARRSADELLQRYGLRTGETRVDAQTIRRFVAQRTVARRARLEGLYASLFAAEPLRDPRLFVAHREGLARVLRVAREWQAGFESGNAVLVLGGTGSGKTSLLGVAQLKIGARRVLLIRRTPADADRLLDAFGRALGCEATFDAVVDAFGLTRTVALLDDLHHWFPPNEKGVADLQTLRTLIHRTERSAFFLTSMSHAAFEVWSKVVPLEHSFACVEPLLPLDRFTLEEAIMTRHELSGLQIEFPTTGMMNRVDRILGRPARTSFMRRLHQLSEGNVRRGLALFRANARIEPGVVRVQTLVGFRPELPFLYQLGPEMMALLAMLVRHGPQTEAVLGEALDLSSHEVAPLCRFLAVAKLVVREPHTGCLSVTSDVVDDLVCSLDEHGLIAEDRR